MRKLVVALLICLAALTGCGTTDADVASRNLSTAADQFQVDRRIVFINGMTDTYPLSIEGRCSVQDQGNQLEVTCKTGPDQYKKHFLGLSGTVSYFVEQLDPKVVSSDYYKVIFKPTVILPDVEMS